MKQNEKEYKISFLGAHFTTIVSVALVLVITGLIALIGIGARNETRVLRQRIELTAVMADSVSNKQALATMQEIKKLPQINSARLATKEEALAAWKQETGEDLERTFGVNILTPEISFTLKADYTSPTQIKSVEKRVAAMPGVEGVAAPDTAMISTMNGNIENLLLMLGAGALAMLVISFVLINNTVHLTVYARRFTIHTMQLVGATNGFIRRPFICNNMWAGLTAGLLACAVTASLAAYAFSSAAGFEACLSWCEVGLTCGGMIVAGMLICAVSAWIATSRYLRKNYDDLFK